MEDSGRYACPSCGVEVVVPIDMSTGSNQEYVEDCPVCCAPVLLQVHVESDGTIAVLARPE
jgi:Cysteine-rich CPXCG